MGFLKPSSGELEKQPADCRSTERQVKSGFNRSGSQRLQCQACRRQYTPRSRPLGYDDKTKEAALKLYLEGNGFRRTGRLLSVNHQSVASWVNACASPWRSPRRRATRRLSSWSAFARSPSPRSSIAMARLNEAIHE